MAALPKKKLYHKLIHAPEDALAYLNLVYCKPSVLNIKRIKNKDNFLYLKDDRPLKNKKDLKRIQDLIIPPAWEDVKIASIHNGHIQAIGRDQKSRKQYLYHDTWNKIRNQSKFYKMYAFGKALPEIRDQVDKDLRQKKFTKTKVLALVVKLLEETQIRIGNQQYAKQNKTYGLSTLRTKHVDFRGNKMKFEFTGKKGKKHKVTLRNKKLIKLVNQCEEIPGWQLFQYYDEEGTKNGIDSTMVNTYLQGVTHDYFTAKDFRTWSASLICFDTLKDLGLECDDKTKDKNILTAIDTAAKALGNTRTVARKYYVHPYILSSYKDGSIEKAFHSADKSYARMPHNFTPSEYAMLQHIKDFNITI